MDVRTLLLQQWASCLDKEDWFPPLEKVLKDITFEQAIWKPVDEMNSIWELVCHLLFYEKRLLMRFLGETANEPQAEDNKSTFRLPTETFQNWKETKQEYFFVHRELEKILAKSEQEDLYRQIPEERSLVLELKSLALHDAYHIGQIVLLSKMQGLGAWKRSF
ncbi:putative damage-inducible protein DinB [Paenibacillus rhizosphaerae]|uniref:Putative damage-inducible protein DinB n=1 Tax=Paenibacillus rhizosphaerae TaxID=297318 RepID=A0A839TNJ6_9BACL|nr:DinB family protein [Paenibacillus rhizosphaerae]MBB3128345.1 putative damage-inducible protein DinB [Paenibacillus rhizosphaerae]